MSSQCKVYGTGWDGIRDTNVHVQWAAQCRKQTLKKEQTFLACWVSSFHLSGWSGIHVLIIHPCSVIWREDNETKTQVVESGHWLSNHKCISLKWSITVDASFKLSICQQNITCLNINIFADILLKLQMCCWKVRSLIHVGFCTRKLIIVLFLKKLHFSYLILRTTNATWHPPKHPQLTPSAHTTVPFNTHQLHKSITYPVVECNYTFTYSYFTWVFQFFATFCSTTFILKL